MASSGNLTLRDIYGDDEMLSKTIVVKNVPKQTSTESLQFYMEVICKEGVEHLIHPAQYHLAVVVFEGEVRDLQSCQNRANDKKLEGTVLIFEDIGSAMGLFLTNIPETCTHDCLLYYFENKRRSGGSEVDNVDHKEIGGKYYAVVMIPDMAAIKSILSKPEHKPNGQLAVQVDPYFPSFHDFLLDELKANVATSHSSPTAVRETSQKQNGGVKPKQEVCMVNGKEKESMNTSNRQEAQPVYYRVVPNTTSPTPAYNPTTGVKTEKGSSGRPPMSQQFSKDGPKRGKQRRGRRKKSDSEPNVENGENNKKENEESFPLTTLVMLRIGRLEFKCNSKGLDVSVVFKDREGKLVIKYKSEESLKLARLTMFELIENIKVESENIAIQRCEFLALKESQNYMIFLCRKKKFRAVLKSNVQQSRLECSAFTSEDANRAIPFVLDQLYSVTVELREGQDGLIKADDWSSDKLTVYIQDSVIYIEGFVKDKNVAEETKRKILKHLQDGTPAKKMKICLTGAQAECFHNCFETKLQQQIRSKRGILEIRVETRNPMKLAIEGEEWVITETKKSVDKIWHESIDFRKISQNDLDIWLMMKGLNGDNGRQFFVAFQRDHSCFIDVSKVGEVAPPSVTVSHLPPSVNDIQKQNDSDHTSDDNTQNSPRENTNRAQEKGNWHQDLMTEGGKEKNIRLQEIEFSRIAAANKRQEFERDLAAQRSRPPQPSPLISRREPIMAGMYGGYDEPDIQPALQPQSSQLISRREPIMVGMYGGYDEPDIQPDLQQQTLYTPIPAARSRNYATCEPPVFDSSEDDMPIQPSRQRIGSIGRGRVDSPVRDRAEDGKKNMLVVNRSKIVLKKGIIVQTRADALVNIVAPSKNLEEDSIVSKSFVKACGQDIVDAYERMKLSSSGPVIVTEAFGELRCNIVLHVALPKGAGNCHQNVTTAMAALFQECEILACKYIAIPPLGVGRLYKYPARTVAQCMLGEAERFLNKNTTVKEISFVIFDDETYGTFDKVFNAYTDKEQIDLDSSDDDDDAMRLLQKQMRQQARPPSSKSRYLKGQPPDDRRRQTTGNSRLNSGVTDPRMGSFQQVQPLGLGTGHFQSPRATRPSTDSRGFGHVMSSRQIGPSKQVQQPLGLGTGHFQSPRASRLSTDSRGYGHVMSSRQMGPSQHVQQPLGLGTGHFQSPRTSRPSIDSYERGRRRSDDHSRGQRVYNGESKYSDRRKEVQKERTFVEEEPSHHRQVKKTHTKQNRASRFPKDKASSRLKVKVFAENKETCERARRNLGKKIKEEFLYEEPLEKKYKISSESKKKIAEIISENNTKSIKGKNSYTIRGHKNDVVRVTKLILKVILNDKKSEDPPTSYKERNERRRKFERETKEFVHVMAKGHPETPIYWKYFQPGEILGNVLTSLNQHVLDKGYMKVDINGSDPIYKAILALVNQTWDNSKIGLGKDATGLDKRNYSKMNVLKIQRIENLKLYQPYANKRMEQFRYLVSKDSGRYTSLESHGRRPIATAEATRNGSELIKDMYPELNEYYFFHGTKTDGVDKICNDGLDHRLGSANAMFGSGVYGAESATKADQYTDDAQSRSFGHGEKKKMFLIRMILGDFFLCKDPNPYKYRRPPCKNCKKDDCKDRTHKGSFDSVVGDNGKLFREFVVYNANQCYPEYLITYERQ